MLLYFMPKDKCKNICRKDYGVDWRSVKLFTDINLGIEGLRNDQ